MKFKVLVFSRDPGGANVVIPIVNPLKQLGYEVILYGKDVSLSKYSAYGLTGKNIEDEILSVNFENIRSFVENIGPDLILTGTSADDFVEKYLWKIGNEKGIPTIAILDQWINYGVRFSKYTLAELEAFGREKKLEFLPLKICVMDELAKREAIEDGIDEERLIITGQPYFETVLENWKNVNSKDVIKAKQNIAHDRFVILFVSEPLSKVYKQANHLDHFYGFTEISIFTELITALENVLDKLHQKPIIIIRNHPKEDPESFKIFLKKYKELITVDNVSNAFELVKIADLVIGMSSMLLIESAILGKSIESVQIGMKRKDNFVLNRLGITSPITNRKCLESKLVSYVNNLDAKKLKFSFINSASANIVNEVKKIYEKTRN